jgi:hypothetical protein
MGKYKFIENDIEITGDWLIENGFSVTDFNVYKKGCLVLVATTFKNQHRLKDIVFFHKKIVLNGCTFNDGSAIRYVSQIPVLTDLKLELIIDKITELKTWVNTELKLQGYEHNLILDKMEELLPA